MQDVLLHICCGICASSVVEQLRKEGYTPKGFFYNPNIHPPREYQRRLEIAKKVSKILGFELIEGPYDKENWDKLTIDLKDEPEGGKRCEVCFKMRLEQTYRKFKELSLGLFTPLDKGYPSPNKTYLTGFTTTLTVSPHKNSSLINRIGKEIDKDNFLEHDFSSLYHTNIEFAKSHGLYRQDYCGCIYSKK